MRIGEPARKYGISDEDIWHAIRNMMRTVSESDDLIMVIGPACSGMQLEIGILGPASDDPSSYTPCGCGRSSRGSSDEGDHAMHSDKEIEEAARRFEQWADELDPRPP